MNWGYKILSVYIIFIAGILFLVFKSSTQNQDLVTKDYYEQELKYQERIDETERANALSSEVKYVLNNESVTIIFPKEMADKKIKAHILLYCIADKSKDIISDQDTDKGMLTVPFTAKNKGLLHELKINWQAAGSSYYYEEKIMIP